MTVLVVDDSRAMRALLGGLLQKNGYEVVPAANGAEALAVLEEREGIALALVDWNMPVMDGLTFIETVRAQRDSASLRILMITTEVEMQQVERALEAGADDYLMKPFEEVQLVERVRSLLPTGA